MGKPDTWCFELMKKQHGLYDVDPSNFLMVGDNLSTDIVFGNQCGMDTLLVLSGVTNGGKAQQLLAGDRLKAGDNIQEEGIPTHVQSLFA